MPALCLHRRSKCDKAGGCGARLVAQSWRTLVAPSKLGQFCRTQFTRAWALFGGGGGRRLTQHAQSWFPKDVLFLGRR